MNIPRLSPRMRDLLIAAGIVSLAALMAAALGGCGGSGAVQASAAQPAAQTHATSDIEPLLDERGNVIVGPSALAAPADPLARSRLGRYATRDQYEWELLINRDRTVLIDLDQTSADASVISALNIGYWHSEPDAVNFFVRSRDARAAASLANTLAELGYLRVFVITR